MEEALTEFYGAQTTFFLDEIQNKYRSDSGSWREKLWSHEWFRAGFRQR